MHIRAFSNVGYVVAKAPQQDFHKPDRGTFSSAPPRAGVNGDYFDAMSVKRPLFRGEPLSELPSDLKAALDAYAQAFKVHDELSLGSPYEEYRQSFSVYYDQQKAVFDMITRLANPAFKGDVDVSDMEEAKTETRESRNQLFKLVREHARTLAEQHGIRDKDKFNEQFLQSASQAAKKSKARIAEMDSGLRYISQVLTSPYFGKADYVTALSQVISLDSTLARETRNRSSAQLFSLSRSPSQSGRSSVRNSPSMLWEEIIETAKNVQKEEGKYSQEELKNLLNNAYIMLQARRLNKASGSETRSLKSKRSRQDGDQTPSDGTQTPRNKRGAISPGLPLNLSSSRSLPRGLSSLEVDTPGASGLVEWFDDPNAPFSLGVRQPPALRKESNMVADLDDLMGPPQTSLTLRRPRDRDSDNSTRELIEWIDELILKEEDANAVEKLHRTRKKLSDKLLG